MNLADAPIWLSGLLMSVAFLVAVEAGYRLHGWSMQGRVDPDGSEGASHIVGAAIGLLGLLIGFTFAMSAERYEARRHLVVEEANAISTVYLRDQLFAEPERGRLHGLLADYVKTRQGFVAAGVDARRLDAVDAATAQVQARIWTVTGAAVRTPAGAALTTSVLQATTDMFDLAASRRAALDSRVPQGVLLMLAVFAFTTAAILGYGLATKGRRHRVASGGLFVLVALAIALIADLDQPRTGTVQISQTPFDRVADSILHDPADRPAP